MPEQIEQPREFTPSTVTQPALHEICPADQEDPAIARQSQQQAVLQNRKTIIEWHQLIGAARLMWNKVSEAELLASEGEEQKLTDIVSSRYVLSHNTANAQVKKFLATEVIAGCFQPAL